jgi:hypothetical protein
MADDGLSFGTNHSAGVCIHFTDKVPSRLRKSGHSALTVTVRDLDGLVSALEPGGPSDGHPADPAARLRRKIRARRRKSVEKQPLILRRAFILREKA